MRINREIRAVKVRVIGSDGGQLGILSVVEAQREADDAGLDLVEIAPNATPPVCKIVDYGKFRYDQTKREKESKKLQHQIKVKEVKLRPNIDDHDFETKLKRARDFLTKGNKVKVTCMFRGREMAHTEIGKGVVKRMCDALEDLGTREAPLKMFGRSLTTVIAPGPKKKREQAAEVSEPKTNN